MIDYEQALTAIRNSVTPLPPVLVPLAEGLNRVLAQDVFSSLDLPPADNSAMDGYAFAYDSLVKGPLTQIGFLPAGGTFSHRVNPGEAVRIMTGAPIPAGCDTVVADEETEKLQDNQFRLRTTLRRGDHVRYRGEEIKTGEKILTCGQQLDPAAIGMLASAGISQVSIFPAPKVAILSTGDELTELDEPRIEGKIINSNAHFLAASLRRDGFVPQLLGIARDQSGELEACLRKGLDADMLITTGGVSVGDRDLVQQTLTDIGFKKIFWKVATKPGKPTLFGMIGRQPVFGLPGNPAASAATYELFARPALLLLAGHRHPISPTIKVRLAETIKGGGKRLHFLWGNLVIDDGNLLFYPSRRQDSGQNRSALGAQAMLPLAIDSPPLAAGDLVDIIMLRLPTGQHTFNN